MRGLARWNFGQIRKFLEMIDGKVTHVVNKLTGANLLYYLLSNKRVTSGEKFTLIQDFKKPELIGSLDHNGSLPLNTLIETMSTFTSSDKELVDFLC